MSKTKKTIFDAAIKVFSNKGYNGSTMDDIALKAGVAKGTLYYHFKSKEEIFNYIITEGMKDFNTEIVKVTKIQSSSLEKLKSLCRVQVGLVYDYRDFFKVIMSQLWGQELRQMELRDIIKKYLETIENYINEAMENGVVRKGNASFMAYTFFGTLCSSAVYEIISDNSYRNEELIDNLMNYVFNGIAEN